MDNRLASSEAVMNKFVLIGVVGLIAYSLAMLSGGTVTIPPEAAARAGNKLVMFTTTHCPYCADARAFLKLNNVAYRECNTETDAACDTALARLGANGVPTLVYDGHTHVGWNPAWLRRVLIQHTAAVD